MVNLPDWLREPLSLGPGWQSRLLLSFLVIASLWALRKVLIASVERRDFEASQRYRWRKVSAWVLTVTGILLLTVIWFEHFRSITTFLGLLTAGLAIALRDFVTAIAGWLFIVLRRPFDVGDRIEVKGHSGDVIDIRIFKFTLMEIGKWVHADQSTGRLAHLPNGLVLTEELFNYTRGFPYIWNEIPVLVTFESNWRRAKEILEEILQETTTAFVDEAREAVQLAANRYMLYFTHLTPIVYTEIADSGVLLTLRHICPPRQRRGVGQSIAEAILERFGNAEDIDLAYPTYRLYENAVEGKPTLRPSRPKLAD